MFINVNPERLSMPNVVKNASKMIFKIGASVSGKLCSSYCFENRKQFESWKATEFLSLVKEYGALTLREFELPGLKVGDQCNVHGEATDVFVIESLIQYSPHRYGFILDRGWSEEVVKCHKEFL